jgi:hypothetical protein
MGPWCHIGADGLLHLGAWRSGARDNFFAKRMTFSLTRIRSVDHKPTVTVSDDGLVHASLSKCRLRGFGQYDRILAGNCSGANVPHFGS